MTDSYFLVNNGTVTPVVPAGMADPFAGIPIDWTVGAGVLPKSGIITIPANPSRKFLLIQNQSNTTIPVGISARLPNNVATTVIILLDPGAGINKQGAADERSQNTYIFTGQLTIGEEDLAGAQVLVLEA